MGMGDSFEAVEVDDTAWTLDLGREGRGEENEAGVTKGVETVEVVTHLQETTPNLVPLQRVAKFHGSLLCLFLSPPFSIQFLSLITPHKYKPCSVLHPRLSFLPALYVQNCAEFYMLLCQTYQGQFPVERLWVGLGWGVSGCCITWHRTSKFTDESVSTQTCQEDGLTFEDRGGTRAPGRQRFTRR
jgi:hypothetical protein